ncbi:MAG: efflux transporter outer membrane subunit [Muribaculaceae bacterium]|nr:efflux transporter outer membrane subunit [Muribaculaceae bacterium]MDE5594380.1 efflux transporter outer membrane subunit [Muribaculaceae bacterium]
MTKSKIASALSAIILLPSSQYAVAEELNDVKSEITTPIVMTEVTGTGDVRQEVEITADDEIDSHWWKRFGDELLDSIITLATERNYDIAIASRRIEIARQAVASARGNYYPQIDINAGWVANRESGAIEGKHVPASKNSYWNGGATMNWEIDLFGKIRAQVKQSNSQLRLSKAEFGAALIAMQAQLATAYVNLRVYQAEMQVAMEHSESQLKVVHITEARHKAGLASMLDVAQAKTVYYSTKASIPQLETSIRGMINSIAILLAENPTDIYPLLRVPTTSLDHTQIVAKSISLDLINRRPDIVAARQKVAAAADALGIAKKDYLPTLSVTGSIGVSTHNLSDAFARNSYVYSVAPTLSWTLFDGFARKSAKITAKQNLESEIDNYNLTILNAITEADNALVAYGNDIDYMKSIQEVVDNSRQSFDLSLDLYKKGLTAFSNVVDAQLNLLEYRNSLIVAKGDALVSLINLCKALGGGWINDID